MPSAIRVRCLTVLKVRYAHQLQIPLLAHFPHPPTVEASAAIGDGHPASELQLRSSTSQERARS